MRRALWSAACLAVLTLGGCGGSGSPLDETARKMDEIRSGELALRVALVPQGAGESFSYELEGPFRFPKEGGTASASLRYRQTRGERTEEARLFVDRGKGWIEVDGNRQTLSEEQLKGLVVASDGEESGFLGSLDIDDWFVTSETHDGPDGTVVVSGEARAGRTLEGLIGLGGGLGEAGPLGLTEDEERRIDRIARTSKLEVVTGSEDHLLRKLRYDLVLGFDVARELRGALAGLSGARLTVQLAIRSPNETVRIRG